MGAPPKSKNTLLELLNPLRHTDHKFLGVAYILVFFASIYYILTDLSWYESSIRLHALTPIIGCSVNLSALRNFKFLSKKAENPGMFAANRTFSYAFLQENLWFQFLLGLTLIGLFPLSYKLLPYEVQIPLLFIMFYIREFVPKTSYTSWRVGNEKVNTRFNGWVDFINLQVKIVRWNYVLKKALLFYMWVVVMAEWVFSVEPGTWLPATERKYAYLLCLDAMHNVTTAFFLQTLKFKGFISAETFSFLFNVSPICGAFITYYFLISHHFIIPYILAVSVDLFINIYIIYPSKSLSANWKNRWLAIVKLGTILAATYYIAAKKGMVTAPDALTPLLQWDQHVY